MGSGQTAVSANCEVFARLIKGRYSWAPIQFKGITCQFSVTDGHRFLGVVLGRYRRIIGWCSGVLHYVPIGVTWHSQYSVTINDRSGHGRRDAMSSRVLSKWMPQAAYPGKISDCGATRRGPRSRASWRAYREDRVKGSRPTLPASTAHLAYPRSVESQMARNPLHSRPATRSSNAKSPRYEGIDDFRRPADRTHPGLIANDLRRIQRNGTVLSTMLTSQQTRERILHRTYRPRGEAQRVKTDYLPESEIASRNARGAHIESSAQRIVPGTPVSRVYPVLAHRGFAPGADQTSTSMSETPVSSVRSQEQAPRQGMLQREGSKNDSPSAVNVPAVADSVYRLIVARVRRERELRVP